MKISREILESLDFKPHKDGRDLYLLDVTEWIGTQYGNQACELQVDLELEMITLMVYCTDKPENDNVCEYLWLNNIQTDAELILIISLLRGK